MKVKDLKGHIAIARTMSYEELCDLIIKLKKEKKEFTETLSSDEKKEYDILIFIYNHERKIVQDFLSDENDNEIYH